MTFENHISVFEKSLELFTVKYFDTKPDDIIDKEKQKING
jgi:hypothetical protein